MCIRDRGAIEVINKSDEFIRKNRNTLIIAVVVLLAVIGGIIAYKNLYKAPRASKAQEAIYKAEQYFDRDSFEIALNGNGADVLGFLEVIDQYGGTTSANLAEAYAGICLYNLGQYDEAIKHLKKFKSKDSMANPSLYLSLIHISWRMPLPLQMVRSNIVWKVSWLRARLLWSRLVWAQTLI